MKNKALLASIAAFALAVLLALGTALLLAGVVERRNATALHAAFTEIGFDWIAVETDGLRAHLTGAAPTESARLEALRVAGRVIDAGRISEEIVVPMSNAIVAPVFRVEMMRNRDALSVIGLVPERALDGPIVDRLQAKLPQSEVSDMLQTADHAVPAGWENAVSFAIDAVERFQVGRISISAGRIEVSALVDSVQARDALETALRSIAPRGQALILDLTAPRPVIAPFLFRIDRNGDGLRVDACAADTEAARTRISAALEEAGFTGPLDCPLALGSPSPRWGQAVATALRAFVQLPEGSLTISDGEVLLVAPHSVPEAELDRAAGQLETSLPDAFSVRALHLDPPVEDVQGDRGRPEMRMVLTEDGALSITGRLPNGRIRDAVRTFASARFGAEALDLAVRTDETLPQGWSVRVLTALEALAELHHGEVTVRTDRIRISGVSGNPDATSQATQVIVQALGADSEFAVDVTYDEALDPVTQEPTPDNCEARIHDILATDKITFDPGSIEINAQAGAVIDRIADVLRDCGELPFEVAGHTDSQGRAETNQGLSQARAEAVINALLTRRVLVSSLVARGYGASSPIADNDTEEGREANRRIEFTLIRPEPDRDPALEAELEFEIQTPDDDTIRPRQRPADEGDAEN
jgi:OmpA-OmpF porin, OOP family